MEYITEPWQAVLIGVVSLGFGVVLWLWLRAGMRGGVKDDISPGEIIARGWSALLDWRPIMSRSATVPDSVENERSRRSYAVEPHQEPSGTEDRELVPELVEQLAELSDDELLETLALLQTEDGEWRYAESRIAKFIPGRVEDRLAQVRAARGTTPEPTPGRVLKVRDVQGERVIPY